MGNDGGTVATKRYLIPTKDTERRKGEGDEEAKASKFTTCALSGEALGEHIVVDELGNLYNKDAVILYILEKRAQPGFSHLRSLKKDVWPVKPTRVAAASSSSASSSVVTLSVKPLFLCPISGLEAIGKHPFVVSKKCACMLSERAVREVGGGFDAATCPACAADLGAAGFIKIAPSADEVEVIRAVLSSRPGTSGVKRARVEGTQSTGGGAAESGSAPADGAKHARMDTSSAVSGAIRGTVSVATAVDASVASAMAGSKSYAALFHKGK